jgi:hypothetical protein
VSLKDDILIAQSKQQVTNISAWIGISPDRFNQMMLLFTEGDRVFQQRASWIISYCVEAHPELICPHFNTVIEAARNPIHGAVRRNMTRLLQFVELPEEITGTVYELCFGFAGSVKEDVAVRAFSISVLGKIVRSYPELKDELLELLKDMELSESAGIRSRVKRVRNELNAISSNL